LANTLANAFNLKEALLEPCLKNLICILDSILISYPNVLSIWNEFLFGSVTEGGNPVERIILLNFSKYNLTWAGLKIPGIVDQPLINLLEIVQADIFAYDLLPEHLWHIERQMSSCSDGAAHE
jgi:hypothetical protein